MLRWFADNSELNSKWEAEIPDILVIGGIVINTKDEPAINNEVRLIKSNYHSCSDYPIKWNIRDLKKYFEGRGLMDLYDRLLESSNECRASLLKILKKYDVTIIVSALLCYGRKRKSLKDTKNDLTSMTFTNGLMRFALHVKDKKHENAEVVLDWPDKNLKTPFEEEYHTAYYSGSHFLSGPLINLGFSDSPLFSSMNENCLLQLSDLVVGASREFLKFSMDSSKENTFGLSCFKDIRPLFRGYPNNVL
ncbi:MAG: DUF3800 domain-containing protein, partial [Thermodesulfobacteriota bacterium]